MWQAQMTGKMSTEADLNFHLDQCVPSLQTALAKQPLDLTKLLRIAVPVRDPNERPLVPKLPDRHVLEIFDGNAVCTWEVPSLTALFRGDKQPPVLGDYPEAYEDSFALFDLHVLELSRLFGDRRDEELLELYSNLRRRPDGRSLGFFHDYLWQAAALILGTRILSKAEYEAILARLERSCRTFRIGPTSRNLVAALRQTMGE
jgi:hypothetical protein